MQMIRRLVSLGVLIDVGVLFLFISFLKLSINVLEPRAQIDIGSGYGGEMEVAMVAPRVSTRVEVGSQLDVGLTIITKHSSYSKLWRMLYFINDAPFCIHTCTCTWVGNAHFRKLQTRHGLSPDITLTSSF